MFKKWWSKLAQGLHKDSPPPAEIYSGTTGGGAPTTSFQLAPLTRNILASSTGPDIGVRALLPCVPDLQVTFDLPSIWAYGSSISLYDSTSGVRAGDPIADCFAVISYENHTLMAVADGVNWGEPARRAARSAVLGSIAYLHKELPIVVNEGDSPAYVYRQLSNKVEELTYSGHAGAYRDPRWTPGALGYALGEEPDLSSMCCSLTLLNEGDIVFLTSDGVADNFDPFILKMARQACDAVHWSSESFDEDIPGIPQIPTMDSNQSHAKQIELLTQAVLQQRDKSNCISAQLLVNGLLNHVTKVTENQRQWAEHKHATQEEERRKRMEREYEPSLSTDCRSPYAASSSLSMPPGKMDHATVSAYVVGAQLGANEQNGPT